MNKQKIILILKSSERTYISESEAEITLANLRLAAAMLGYSVVFSNYELEVVEDVGTIERLYLPD